MHAIILFAHGSRDPRWHKPIQSVAQRIEQRSPETAVRCAYLELTEPDLPHVAQELIDQGATSLSVVPLFLGVGRHAREDLPQLIAEPFSSCLVLPLFSAPAMGPHGRTPF